MEDSATLTARPLGRTGVSVTPLCVGTSPLASMSRLYGYEVDDRRAIETVTAVFDSAIRFIDTSNEYGDGRAEERIGAAIKERGGLPDDFVLATKVDPDPDSGDFSAARAFASYDQSLGRLGLERTQILYLHDPERIGFEAAMAADGPVASLITLREQQRVDAIGVAGGSVALLKQFVDTGVFDIVLCHNRYTLLARSAQELFADAHRRGLGVVNAAPYGGGLLAKGPDQRSTYGYREADSELLRITRAIDDICRRHAVPLAAAALQFSVRAPFVDATVFGVSKPERVTQAVDFARHPIPAGFWDEIDALTSGQGLWERA